MAETQGISNIINKSFSTARNSLNVNVNDGITEPVSIFLGELISTDNLTSGLSIDDNIITIGTTGTTAGRHIEIREGNRFFQSEISSATSKNLTLDSLVDYAFTTDAEVDIKNIHMNINGTTASTFYVMPPPEAEYDISRMIILINDGLSMDDGTFGGIPALTNGVVFRKDGSSAVYNLFVAKKNGDFAAEAYDIAYTAKAPAGENGFRCRRTWAGAEKTGVVIRLSTGDRFEAVVRDNLSALTDMVVKVQGHITE